VATQAAAGGGDRSQLDPYADIAAVVGDAPRMLTQEVLQRLAQRNPGVYRQWTHADLKRVLEAYGAEPYKSDGRMVVSRDRVQDARAQHQHERDRAREESDRGNHAE
jgi:hypothetical protein